MATTLNFFNNESLQKDEYLQSYEGQIIQVRGFLYQKGDGTWVLASQPNLRSCCIGTGPKIEEQMIVMGDLEPTFKALTLEGIFNIDPRYNDRGDLIQLYVLQQAKVVAESHASLGLVWIVVGICLILFFMKRKRTKRTERTKGRKGQKEVIAKVTIK